MSKEQKKILRIDSEEASQSELTEEFKSVVKQVMKDLNIKKDSPELRACPDMSVGKIENLHKSSSFSYCKITDTPNAGMVKREGRKAILLILESPHKEEYKEEPIDPAKGCTGCAIRNHFLEIFDGCEEYELCLINLIQYQCSQGLTLSGEKTIKDKVIRRLLRENGRELFKENFLKRVHQVLESFDEKILINATPQQWTKRVERWIKGEKEMSTVAYCNVLHPSSWCRELDKNREMVQKQREKWRNRSVGDIPNV